MGPHEFILVLMKFVLPQKRKKRLEQKKIRHHVVAPIQTQHKLVPNFNVTENAT